MARTKRTANPNAAIAYVRVSTSLQAEEGMSLDAQERMVRGYCAMRGFDLVELVEPVEALVVSVARVVLAGRMFRP
jgi:hypothetical protein